MKVCCMEESGPLCHRHRGGPPPPLGGGLGGPKSGARARFSITSATRIRGSPGGPPGRDRVLARNPGFRAVNVNFHDFDPKS
jgi:hypothetical protein